MRANAQAGINLRSAIDQLKHVAQTKRVQAQHSGRDETTLIQEARQLEEAVRLLRWISK